MKIFPVILCLLALAYTIFVSVSLFGKNVLPIDRGHRCFGVKDKRALDIVLGILRENGLEERFTFDTGPIQQTLMWDNTTVLTLSKNRPETATHYPVDMNMPETEAQETLPLGGLSLPVKDPKKTVEAAAFALTKAGYPSRVFENVIPEAGEKLVILQCDAFVDWVLVPRRHIVVMGAPPNQRKISQ